MKHTRKAAAGQKSLSSFAAAKRKTKKSVTRPEKVSVSGYTMPAHSVPSHKVKAHRCKGQYVGKQIRPAYNVKSHKVGAYKRKYPRK